MSDRREDFARRLLGDRVDPGFRRTLPPVPPAAEEGVPPAAAGALPEGLEAVPSACFSCNSTCEVLILRDRRSGRVRRVIGDPQSPVTRGILCAKGLASPDLLENPGRLLHPLKRVGGRGEGRWERISWEEALSLTAEKLLGYRRTFGPGSLVFLEGTRRGWSRVYSRLAYAFGVFNHGAAGWAQCLWPRLVDCRVTFGSPYTESADYSRTRCVLVWGTNPAATWPVQAAGIMDARQRGARLIVVDPWLSETAAKADLWLQLRPGTDTALALSMLHVILGEGRHDRAFVERWTVGCGELARHVEPYTPEWGERVTRVPAPLIREAARAYAAARPACLYRCVALDQLHDSVQACRAVSLLVAVTGNVGVPGGNVLPSARGEISQNTLEFIGHGWMPQEEQAKRPGYDRYPLLCGELSPVPSAHMPTLWENMATGVPHPIRAALIFGSNALVSYSNTRRVREALDRLEFLVVADLFLTPTAERADLVLPASSWLERNNLISSFQSSATCTLVQQRAATLGEARSDIDIVLDLARRLGLADRFWESEEALFDHLLRPTGLTFRDLARRRRLQAPLAFRSYEKKGFATPSGKVELYSSLLEKAGCAPLPTWTEPPSSAAAAAAPPGSAAPGSAPPGDSSRPAGPRAEYPYILTTGARVPAFRHTENRLNPLLREQCPHPVTWLHPDTARAHGIGEGDPLVIETAAGWAVSRARLTAGIHPDVVEAMPGWGGEGNINRVIPWESCSEGMGSVPMRGLPCRIRKEDQSR